MPNTKIPTRELSQLYLTALSSFSVSTHILEGQAKPFIRLSFPSKITGENKSRQLYDIVTYLDIVTEYKGQKQCEDIAESVLDIIYPDGNFFVKETASWEIQNVSVSFPNVTLPEEQSQTGVINRLIIQIKQTLILK